MKKIWCKRETLIYLLLFYWIYKKNKNKNIEVFSTFPSSYYYYNWCYLGLDRNFNAKIQPFHQHYDNSKYTRVMFLEWCYSLIDSSRTSYIGNIQVSKSWHCSEVFYEFESLFLFVSFYWFSFTFVYFRMSMKYDSVLPGSFKTRLFT